MKRVNSGIVLVALAALALVVACERPLTAAGPEHALSAGPQAPLPAFRLQTQHRSPFTNADLLGRWTLLFSGFTHCPDICPATLGVLRAAQADLPPRDDIQTVFVTVDPGRDTPAALAEYLAWFDKDWIGLTGEVSELDRLLDPLQMAHVRVPTGDGQYTMDHASAVALIDPQGRLKAWWRAPIEAAALAEDLRGLPKN